MPSVSRCTMCCGSFERTFDVAMGGCMQVVWWSYTILISAVHSSRTVGLFIEICEVLRSFVQQGAFSGLAM